MTKFFLKTHGCKSNQLESVIIREKLIEAGLQECEYVEDADVFILNSCSVTENADNESIRTIRNAKKKNNDILTILTGCSAQLNFEKLSMLSCVDIVLGNDDKFNIVEAINSKLSHVTDIFNIHEFNNQIIHKYSKTRGYLKIQDGCDNYCSYCTIPLARGRSRSNSIDNIIEQVKIYTDIGIKEVVLTGIHIGQWGKDFVPESSLYSLLEEIEKTGIERYRLGSLNTLEVDENLLDFLSKSSKFCPHFHLSLQSLNDKILADMNRKYTAKSCLDLIEKINNTFNLPFMGCDVITGFPGETDEDFQITFDNLKKAGLSNIHVFPYSVRKNTKAAVMCNQVPESVKHVRANILHKLAKEKFINFVKNNVGTVQSVLIEKKPDKTTGKLKGVTKNYLNVLLDISDRNFCNTIQNVNIINLNRDTGILEAVLL